jgi:hypothetical protein
MTQNVMNDSHLSGSARITLPSIWGERCLNPACLIQTRLGNPDFFREE